MKFNLKTAGFIYLGIGVAFYVAGQRNQILGGSTAAEFAGSVLIWPGSLAGY